MVGRRKMGAEARRSGDSGGSGGSGEPQTATSGEKRELGGVGLLDWGADTILRRFAAEPEYIKVLARKKGARCFRRLFVAQELQPPVDSPLHANHSSQSLGQAAPAGDKARSVWLLRFSKDGKYLASGGKGRQLCVWKVIASPMERWNLLPVYGGDKHHSNTLSLLNQQLLKYSGKRTEAVPAPGPERKEIPFDLEQQYAPVFHPDPHRVFGEHLQDILDCDWSKNSFLLTASMDKTVKLWHINRTTSLKTFVHPDFVTCVRFHPHDDRFFFSGCLDHTVRTWSILEGEVAEAFNCGDLIMALDVSPDGNWLLIGTFNGYVHVLHTNGLKLLHSFHLLQKPNETENRPRHGPKITGVEFIRHKAYPWLGLLITSNDSRVRLFDMSTTRLLEIFRGFSNESSRISAHHLEMEDGESVVLSASENHWLYTWMLHHEEYMYSHSDLDNARTVPSPIDGKDPKKHSIRNIFRRSISFNSDILSESNPVARHHFPLFHHKAQHKGGCVKNSEYITFHAHHNPVTAATIAPKETTHVLSLSDDIICELNMKFGGEALEHLRTKSIREPGSPAGRSDHKRNHSAEKNYSQSTAKQNVGTIIVSAAATGQIRVFRTDVSSSVRAKALEAIRAAHGLPGSPERPLKPVLSALAHPLSAGVAKGKHICGDNRSAPSTTCPRCAPSAVNGQQDESASTAEQSTSSPKPTCDVCGGQKLSVVGKKTALQKTKSLYCLECGNHINRFK
ncbi:ABL024Wp [Eremothecium gossypii ATCC 10895]|uniref:ABL024Wp n=1 Tax=Eremothecium gossypii (strain ATCC 10895 / CBS 109.51 / FGSC 9923 / NRRL Y-1056) TaxID=284811 RepID=Q75DP1_EREGS|nr:ABL024Wp [Eremothecium gossypii ATCC 10895]AAS50747.1 ABL024Wp [Eremothecium gossypii ATCC 10895]